MLMHQTMAQTLDKIVAEIQHIQGEAVPGRGVRPNPSAVR
jgi:hypothetical protein